MYLVKSVYTCVHACMCGVYVHVCGCVPTYMCIYVCMHVDVYTYRYICMYMYVYVHVYVQHGKCVRLCVCICMYMYVHVFFLVANLDGPLWPFVGVPFFMSLCLGNRIISVLTILGQLETSGKFKGHRQT